MGSNGGMERRRRPRLVAAAVLAALFVSVWWFDWMLRRDATVSDVRARTPPPAVAAVPAELPPPEPHASSPAPPQPSPAAEPSPAPESDGKAYRNWSASVAMFPIDVGRRMGPSLKFGLDAVRNNDMVFCFQELKRAREVPDAEWVPLRAGDLLLYLEARDGAVDVVDAKVARPGTLPSAVLDCCREILRGIEIKVFFAVPGQRYRYVYEVEE